MVVGWVGAGGAVRGAAYVVGWVGFAADAWVYVFGFIDDCGECCCGYGD